MRDVTNEYRNELQNYQRNRFRRSKGQDINSMHFLEFDNLDDAVQGSLSITKFPTVGICFFDCNYSVDGGDESNVDGEMTDYHGNLNVTWKRNNRRIRKVLGGKESAELSGFIFTQLEFIDPKYFHLGMDYDLIYAISRDSDRNNLSQTDPQSRRSLAYQLLTS